MDRVRLGRVLGRGTRMAARTLYEAVDAATSAAPAESARQSAASRATGKPVRTGIAAPAASSPSKPLSRRPQPPRPSLFAPVKRASRAVSLELTGSFFALFAFAFAVAGWRARAALHNGGDARFRFLVYCAVALVFTYFSVSNFVRARRLQ